MEPTSALSYYELVRKIAEFIGVAYYGSAGSSAAMVPTELHDLDMVKRIVNNGIRMFISAAPENGWKWQRRILSNTLRISNSGTATSGSATTLVQSAIATTYANDYYNNAILEITGGAGFGETALITDYDGTTGTFTFSGGLSNGTTVDTTTTYEVGSRYKLPDDFGGTADGPIRYSRESNRGTIIDWVHESIIRVERENVSSDGYPRKAAIRPYGIRQFELMVWPDPVTLDVVEFPYTAFYDDLQMVTGTATAADATSITDTNNRLEVDDIFNDQILTIQLGKGVGETATITDFDQGTNKLTFAGGMSGSTTPDTTSVYSIEPVSNLHPAGFRFDDVILTACLARAEMEVEDLAAGWANLYTTMKLSEAYKIDARSAPRKLGYFGNGALRSNDRLWIDVSKTSGHPNSPFQ